MADDIQRIIDWLTEAPGREITFRVGWETPINDCPLDIGWWTAGDLARVGLLKVARQTAIPEPNHDRTRLRLDTTTYVLGDLSFAPALIRREARRSRAVAACAARKARKAAALASIAWQRGFIPH